MSLNAESVCEIVLAWCDAMGIRYHEDERFNLAYFLNYGFNLRFEDNRFFIFYKGNRDACFSYYDLLVRITGDELYLEDEFTGEYSAFYMSSVGGEHHIMKRT